MAHILYIFLLKFEGPRHVALAQHFSVLHTWILTEICLRLRLVKAHPGWRTYGRAMAAKRSVLQVIARTIVRDDQTGADRIMIGQGSSFVIKVNQQAQESFVLTSAHVMGDRLKPGDDGLCVRLMVPGGVLEFAATIIHSDGPMDVALLRVPGLTRATPLRFAPEDPVLGEGIAAVGYCNPENLFPVLSFTRKPAISPGRVRYVHLFSF
jgi:S1-C subfamily serine protease